ncbi:coadhesin-like [Mya arenaria]|uniref:coadhesin-like n=1 Tax=Mya arenaria TaxID=6604 RepID=UPI0022E5DEDE|nr:coadhesin-like [Mya arenaria]
MILFIATYLVVLELASGFLLDNHGTIAIPNVCLDAQPNCDVLNQTYNVCHDIHNGEHLCRRFCGLCNVVDGGWGFWGSWSTCDVTCGNGTRTRSRQCESPAPQNGGDDCSGKNTEQITCILNPCPVHGGWSGWSEWGLCSVTCGVGLSRRDRYCDSPYPSRDGNHCFGDGLNYNICTGPSCSAWSTWNSWSSCSNTCGHGLMQRSRNCTGVTGASPNMCLGEPIKYKACKTSCSEHYHARTSAFAANSLAQTSSDSLVFQSTFFNEGSDYNTSTGVFTCRIPGIYFFAITLTKSRESGVDFVRSFIQFTNGNLLMHVDPYDDLKTDYGEYIMSSSTTLKLNQTDTVRIRGGSAANHFNADTASFTGFLVRADDDLLR